MQKIDIYIKKCYKGRREFVLEEQVKFGRRVKDIPGTHLGKPVIKDTIKNNACLKHGE
jgi:hypothetical protein